jgi:hypothetical protein
MSCNEFPDNQPNQLYCHNLAPHRTCKVRTKKMMLPTLLSLSLHEKHARAPHHTCGLTMCDDPCIARCGTIGLGLRWRSCEPLLVNACTAVGLCSLCTASMIGALHTCISRRCRVRRPLRIIILLGSLRRVRSESRLLISLLRAIGRLIVVAKMGTILGAVFRGGFPLSSRLGLVSRRLSLAVIISTHVVSSLGGRVPIRILLLIS